MRLYQSLWPSIANNWLTAQLTWSSCNQWSKLICQSRRSSDHWSVSQRAYLSGRLSVRMRDYKCLRSESIYWKECNRLQYYWSNRSVKWKVNYKPITTMTTIEWLSVELFAKTIGNESNERTNEDICCPDSAQDMRRTTRRPNAVPSQLISRLMQFLLKHMSGSVSQHWTHW